MVPKVGIEPTRGQAPPDFESGASASSATSALVTDNPKLYIYIIIYISAWQGFRRLNLRSVFPGQFVGKVQSGRNF